MGMDKFDNMLMDRDKLLQIFDYLVVKEYLLLSLIGERQIRL